jgi:hypothetical protein
MGAGAPAGTAIGGSRTVRREWLRCADALVRPGGLEPPNLRIKNPLLYR